MKQIEDINVAVEQTRLLREKLLADDARPGYHFAIPEDMGLPGDSNGAFFANGRYHLMYLYRCVSDGFRYGHMSSHDLIHWRSHPDSIKPDELDGGIFSGGAFVDDDGTVYVTYWGLERDGVGHGVGGIRIAMSRDVANHYEKWEKFPEYAVESTEWGITEVEEGSGSGGSKYLCSADPSNIWKSNGVYYMQTGNLLILNKYRNMPDAPKNMLGDWTDLFKSDNLHDWSYVGRFYQRDVTNKWTDESEDDMCPSFLPLPKSKEGGESSGKYLQLYISHNKGCQYYIGSFDNTAGVFTPDSYGKMSWIDNSFFAPEALIAPDGRQIMWSWLLNVRPDTQQYGWSGVYGLPRSLWLNEDGSLGIAPISELEKLRYNRCDSIEKICGTSCEIRLEIDMNNATRVGLKVRCSSDSSEETLIYYDAFESVLVCDTCKSGSIGIRNVEKASFALKENETLSLIIYIDKSIVEVFANDRQAITRRVYPSPESTQIKHFSDGDARIISLKCWEMMPSNMY